MANQADLAERKQLVYKAKLAEQAERYDEMAEFMKEAAELESALDPEERNLLSVAYKNAVGTRRASWRVVSAVERKHANAGNAARAQMVGEYRAKIEAELRKTCDEILALLDDHLLNAASSADGKVFYHKMAGDYCRYLAEFSSDKNKTTAIERAQAAYERAIEIAQKDLPATNAIRLGLALNFSVFHYEILDQRTAACEMARSAFDKAITELDNVTEASYRDCTLIMQLLRDNLTLWEDSAEKSLADMGGVEAAVQPAADGAVATAAE